MRLSLFLLPTLCVAFEADVSSPAWLRGDRVLQTACAQELAAFLDCRNVNQNVCNSDRDPLICGTAVDNSQFVCAEAFLIACEPGVCCSGKCSSEIQAIGSCFLRNFGCIPSTCPVTPVPPAPAPAPPAPAPPAPAPGCFSATSTVHVLGQGSVPMQDLKVGDEVLTGSPGNFKYQSIFAFGHLDQEALSDFYAITVKGNKAPLEMTGEHLVYLDGKPNPVRADSLQVGDSLLSTKGPAEISVIKMVNKHGLYNPLTADGRLIVNDVAVSTYIALQESNPEHYQLVLGLGNNKVNLVSHQNFVHLYLTPFRMLCMGVSSQLCQVYDEEGIPYYISQGMKLVHWIGAQNVMVQLIFFLITVPIFVAFLAMEMLVGSSAAPLAIVILVLISKKAPKFIMTKKQKSV